MLNAELNMIDREDVLTPIFGWDLFAFVGDDLTKFSFCWNRLLPCSRNHKKPPLHILLSQLLLLSVIHQIKVLLTGESFGRRHPH